MALLRVVGLCLGLVGAAAPVSAFDLSALPSSGVGESAWQLTSACKTSDRGRAQNFVRTVKSFIAGAARSEKTARSAITSTISAQYERWGSSYAVSFDLSRPLDLEWLAGCLRVAGAENSELVQRRLHVRSSTVALNDLEFSPDAGFYFVVRFPR